MSGMPEERLEEIRERLEADLMFPVWALPLALRTVEDMSLELLAEVDLLRGRLEAVCGVLSDAAGIGEDVDPSEILRAVRGH